MIRRRRRHKALAHGLPGADVRPTRLQLTFERLEPRRVLATFTVTNADDEGEGSLRQAIEDANAAEGADTIVFGIPGDGVHSIQPASPLPSITDPVTLDGYTQPGAAPNTNPVGMALNTVLRIELDGGNLASSAAGITLDGAGGSTIRGLVINRFGTGISAISSAGQEDTLQTIEGNFIGTDATGSSDRGNGMGISVLSSGNLVGGTSVAARNLISGNGVGVLVSGDNNLVQGNLVGTERAGSRGLGNAVGIQVVDGTGVLIGGSEAASANTIAFNARGVEVDQLGDATAAAIRRNSIFLNMLDGIDLNGDGPTANDPDDPDLGANRLQNFPEFTSTANFAGGVVEVDYRISTAPENASYPLTVEFFLADSDGEEGRTFLGSEVYTADVFPASNTASISAGSEIIGNRIIATATDSAGNTSEFSSGIVVGSLILTVSNTNDGGPGSLRQAIEDANSRPGEDFIEFNIPGDGRQRIQLLSELPAITETVSIDGYTQPGSAPNTNPVGQSLNATLNVELNGSGLDQGTALSLDPEADGSVIRGLVIDSFPDGAIVIEADNVRVEGNSLTLNGELTDQNADDFAIEILGAGNTIGGTSAAARNLISGNANGVRIAGADAIENAIQGNLIGTDATGTEGFANGTGISIVSASGNTVGGASIGAANVIAFNRGDGVVISETTAGQTLGNAIVRNSIFGNVEQGIDLGDDGQTLNDADDPDLGANRLQNFPEFTSTANFAGGVVEVDYRISTAPENASYPLTVEFFLADSDGEEGRTFLGSDVYAQDDFPTSKTASIVTGPEIIGNRIIATATDSAGNTSEFSSSIEVVGSLALAVTNTNDDGPGSFRQAIEDANSRPGEDFIEFNIPGDGRQRIQLLSELPAITETVSIDGYTQPGSAPNTNPVGQSLNATLNVELNGSGLDQGTALSLDPEADGSVIRGLAIDAFPDGAILIEADNVRVEGNSLTLNGELTDRNNFAIEILGAGNTIGGTAAEARNLISGNANGVRIGGSDASDNVIQGNLIGTDATGAVGFANGTGISIVSASANTVGGTAAGAANLIAFNIGDGIIVSEVIGGPATGNSITRNSLFRNGQQAIDLGNDGQTVNDADDPDVGANRLQNFPEFASTADFEGGAVNVDYLVSTSPENASYPLTVEFFLADSDGEEGRTFLSSDVYAEGDFPAAKTASISTDPEIIGSRIVMTATDSAGNTSEFSSSIVVGPLVLAVTNTNDDGPGSFRQAIENANSRPGEDRIEFSIPGDGRQRIQLLSELPAITEALSIDGYTQPGAEPNTNPVGQSLNATLNIELNGSELDQGTALSLSPAAEGSVIRGLVIDAFPGGGIIIAANNVRVEGNAFTLNGELTGENADDFAIEVRGAGNTIGGTAAADRNLISGNANGVRIIGAAATENVIQGNLIGADSTGTEGFANGTGISIVSAGGNMVGGTSVEAANVIAFNRGDGVVISETLDGPALGNAIVRNSIFGNLEQGIDLGGDGQTVNDADDPDAGANRLQNFPEFTSAANFEGGAVAVDYRVSTAPENASYPLVVEFFLTDTDGEEGRTFLSSDMYAVGDFPASKTASISAGPDIIGSRLVMTATDAAGNTSEFSSSIVVGPLVLTVTNTNDDGPGSLRGAIEAANARLGEDSIEFDIPGDGVQRIQLLSELPPITEAVSIDGYTQPGAAPNTNPVGQRLNAMLKIELNGGGLNQGAALTLGPEADGSIIRGLLIDEFSDDGIVIAADNVRVEGNSFAFIGEPAIDNLDDFAIEVLGADNIIGGTAAEARNLISGNANGVRIAGSVATGNAIQGNLIGTDVTGIAGFANGTGIAIVSANETTVGGTVAGAGNVIAFNRGDGVVVSETTEDQARGNAILGNSIYRNAGQGIDLGDDGQTPNDPDDPDLGANQLQNFVEFTSDVLVTSGFIEFQYKVSSAPTNAAYPLAVEFFIADSDGEEGQTRLAQDTYLLDSFPNSRAVAIPAGSVQVGDRLVATVTDDDGNTSEFSPGAFVFQGRSVLISAADGLGSAPDDGAADRFRIVRNDQSVDVFVNGRLARTEALAGLLSLTIQGSGDDDSLEIDASGGVIPLPQSIRFLADGGFDTVIVTDTSQSLFNQETVAIGSLPGDGIHTLDDQVVEFSGIEPLVTNVIVANLRISSDSGLASLLQDDNRITYLASPRFGAAYGRVTIDSFEPIDFTNKQNLTIESREGDDIIRLNNTSLPTGLESVSVAGGGGDDLVEVAPSDFPVPVTLFGGTGNDWLRGGDGDDILAGGAGSDTLVHSAGDDVLDGGTGFDEFLIEGTSGNDLIEVTQSAPGQAEGDRYQLDVGWDDGQVQRVGQYQLMKVASDLAPSDVDNRPTVEEVRVEAGGGNDLIRVTHADAYTDEGGDNGVATQMLRFSVAGDAPNASDRLVVRDDGLGDLVLIRQAADGRSGRVTVAPAVNDSLGEVVYEGIEHVDVVPLDPVTGGTGPSDPDLQGRLVLFEADLFELNNTRAAATDVNRLATANRDPTIDPGGSANGPVEEDDVAGDEDWYEFRPTKTAPHFLEVRFERIATVPSGRPGLPGGGDLEALIYDDDGELIAVGSDVPGTGLRATFAAEVGQSYFLRVRGAAADGETVSPAINTYALEVAGLDSLDTVGPQVTAVFLTDDPGYDLFGSESNGPTPLARSISVGIQDLPPRDDGDFQLPAVFSPQSTVNDSEDNDSIATAQNVDAFFSLSFDSLIGDTTRNTSTDIPHATILGSGDGTFDYYAFSAREGDKAIFDIDLAAIAPDDINTELFLYDLDGTLLAENDDADITFGAAGSVREEDSYLEHIFAQAGTYVVGVGRFDSVGEPGGITGNVPQPGDSYTLHISVENHPVSVASGTIRITGDHSGVIPIESVRFEPESNVAGEPAVGTLVVEFPQPLPDDRFTLTVSDAFTDPAGNALDGESNASGAPILPSGNGVPGGDFVARFTIDSRPEIGAWGGGTVAVDTNGNFVFDPRVTELVNRDTVYVFGYATDLIFAGNFNDAGPDGILGTGDDGPADGFDKLAAYGFDSQNYRWLIDGDNDGVPEQAIIDPARVNGFPVSGNFDGDATNGDEVGLLAGTTWYLDVNHDFRVDSPIEGNMRGFPIVGRFDGDEEEDLGVYRHDLNRFEFDLNRDGTSDRVVNVDFGSSIQRPVAADFNGDGFGDLGLWVPQSGVTAGDEGQWFLYLTQDTDGDGQPNPILDRVQGGTIAFAPPPFGVDLFTEFGDRLAQPVAGNFDPPVAPRNSAADRPPLTPADDAPVTGDDPDQIEETLPGNLRKWADAARSLARNRLATPPRRV